MILDKFSEFIYEQSSLFFSKWRIGCFMMILLILTGIAFDLVSRQFWLGSVLSAVDIFSGVFLLPVYLMLAIFCLCFFAAPAVSKFFSLFVLKFEYRRAEHFMMEMQEQVVKVSSDALPLYRDRALEGESYIQWLRGLNESLICFSIFGFFMAIYRDVIFIYYSIVLVVPFLLFFSVQTIFSKYLKTIFFYKKLSEHISLRNKQSDF